MMYSCIHVYGLFRPLSMAKWCNISDDDLDSEEVNAESVEVKFGNDTGVDQGEIDNGEANSGEGDDGEDNSGETDDGGTGSGEEEEYSQSYDGVIIGDEAQITRLARSFDGDTTLSKKL